MRHCLILMASLAGTWLPLAGYAGDDSNPAGSPADSPVAEGRNHLRLQYAKSSETDFVTVVAGDYQESSESNSLVGASWGRDLSKTLFGKPVLTTANVGVQYFNERGYQDDGYGANAYIKLHYSWALPLTEKQIRFGLGEGLSYVSQIPISEKRDFAKKGVESARLLNYLEWTIDVPLRQFATMDRLIGDDIDDVYVGFIVWHRSSVFGLFADKQGGVNFMGFGIEARY